MENFLYKWFLKQREKHVPISAEIIKQRAKLLNAKLKEIENFVASDGWLQRFKTRYGIMLISDDTDNSTCEEIEMQNTAQLKPYSLNEIAGLLHPQYAIITGGKSRDGCPLITFPDNNNFHTLTDTEYQQLMLYLTSVPSLQEADLGFHLIIDRRKDRWNSVKTVLLKISVFFPGLVHVVYVIRPASFLQKALSEVSNKLFKEDFKFRMIVLSSVEELHDYIDISQLTSDLGGKLPYVHSEWIEQRTALERFSNLTHQISNSLDEFTKCINETEFPNNVDSTQQLLNQQMQAFSELKEEILSAAKHGEALLYSIKEKSVENMENVHVFAVERLLIQLEETERTFDEFWQQHSSKLRHCLELRRFEQDFRELQTNLDSHIKKVSEMTEVGDSINRVETLIRETGQFEKLCMVDIERAEEVISTGLHLIQVKNFSPLECIQPKCAELNRMKDILVDKLSKRTEKLLKCKELMERIQRANQWCASGLELLSSQKLENLANSTDLAEKALRDVEDFISSAQEFTITSPKEFKKVFQDTVSPETKALIAQLLQKIDDISTMCEKRVQSIKNLKSIKHKDIILVPKQPSCGAPQPNKAILRKANTIPKLESPVAPEPENPVENNTSQDEVSVAKRGHVLAELLETERIYVTELGSILKGYKMEAFSEEMQPIIPLGFTEKLDIIFGNLDEIFLFHSNIFLKDLENCISSVDLVALCFVQRRDAFYKLYSYYCQNIPRAEHLRDSMTDATPFFQACQKKLGHKLPLAAYLLKPVQRVTKYQLLLKDLLRYCQCHKELQQALDCMLIVLKCVNDSMHQISITGFPLDLSQQGELLMQGSFSVWAENKKDLRLRIKPMQRHIFLYSKAMLFCKPATKNAHNKATYQFKHFLKMSQIGMTESVKGDSRKFEVWLQGRQEVYTIQAATLDEKQAWVKEIKKVLINQLEELKGEKIKQYSALAHKPLRQAISWDKPLKSIVPSAPPINHQRAVSYDLESTASSGVHDGEEAVEGNWSSDCSNSEDEDQCVNTGAPNGRYVALADYCAVGNSEVNMREGDTVELLKVGCAGWWFVRVLGNEVEGWAPAAYLEHLHRKTSRASSRSQDKLNDQ